MSPVSTFLWPSQRKRTEGRKPGAGGSDGHSEVLSGLLMSPGDSTLCSSWEARVKRMGIVSLFTCVLVSFYSYTTGKDCKNFPLLIKIRKSV